MSRVRPLTKHLLVIYSIMFVFLILVIFPVQSQIYNALRLVIGTMCLLFLPGYCLLSLIKKGDVQFKIENIVLEIGLSICITMLTGLAMILMGIPITEINSALAMSSLSLFFISLSTLNLFDGSAKSSPTENVRKETKRKEKRVYPLTKAFILFTIVALLAVTYIKTMKNPQQQFHEIWWELYRSKNLTRIESPNTTIPALSKYYSGEISLGGKVFSILTLDVHTINRSLVGLHTPTIDLHNRSLARSLALGVTDVAAIDLNDNGLFGDKMLIFSDDFGNITRSSALWKPEGGNWSFINGTYEADAIGLESLSIVKNKIGLNVTDGSVEVKVKNVANEWSGIAFRIQNETNYYMLAINAEGNYFNLINVINGTVVTSIKVDQSTPIDLNTWYSLKVDFFGPLLRCYLNGVLKIEVSDTTFASGSVGVVARDAKALFDDFSTSKFSEFVKKHGTFFVGNHGYNLLSLSPEGDDLAIVGYPHEVASPDFTVGFFIKNNYHHEKKFLVELFISNETYYTSSILLQKNETKLFHLNISLAKVGLHKLTLMTQPEVQEVSRPEDRDIANLTFWVDYT